MKTKILYAPKGVHTITPHVNGEAKTVTVEFKASVVDKLNADLATLRASKITPCGFFDHTPAGARSFIAESFTWDESKGIIANVVLTTRGKDAIDGKDYGFFSPRFALLKGEIAGLVPDSAEVGSFVNEPAFREMPEIIAASHASGSVVCASLAHALEVAEAQKKGDNNQKGDNAPLQPNKQMKEELIKLFSLAEDADDDEILDMIKKLRSQQEKPEEKKKLMDDLNKAKKEVEEVTASQARVTDELAAAQGEISTLRAELKEKGDAAADAFVEVACSTGKIPPRDDAARASLKQLYLDNPAHATSVMAAVTASHAPTKLGGGESKQHPHDALIAHLEGQFSTT